MLHWVEVPPFGREKRNSGRKKGGDKRRLWKWAEGGRRKINKEEKNNQQQQKPKHKFSVPSWNGIVPCVGEGNINISNCPMKRSRSYLKNIHYLFNLQNWAPISSPAQLLKEMCCNTVSPINTWYFWGWHQGSALQHGRAMIPPWESQTHRMQLEGVWKVEWWRTMKGPAIFCCETSFATKICATHFELLLSVLCGSFFSGVTGQWR